MESQHFSALLSPLQLGPVRLRNRIVFTGHDTLLQNPDGTVSDAYIAYQVARAKGGAGVQMLSGAAIDQHSATAVGQLRVDADDVIPGLRRMAEAVHAHDGIIFAQLLQPGREIYSSPDGAHPLTFSASDAPNERFGTHPRALTKPQIKEIIAAYAAAARRAIEAGMDGVEIVGNQGNLPAQFLAAHSNKRTDEYGGALENRLRFTLEAARAVRTATAGKAAFGVRLSATDMDVGVTEEESLALCRALDDEGLVDYLSLVLGSPVTRGGSHHIVAPMSERAGYVGPYTQRIKQAVKAPIIATGRFNTPQTADAAIRNGEADAIGMTRAMICDPDIGVKIAEDRLEDIRACIACVQACIGHYQKHAPVSCIQFPESGRETTLARYSPATQKRKILVAGGGPAGMKAAAVAGSRGHSVVLCEAQPQLGGQALLAQRLPTRAEFGGLITNLQREVDLAGVELRRKTRVDLALIEQERPDVVVIATGGVTAWPEDTTLEGVNAVTADDILRGGAKIGKRVVVADRQSDWVGIGIAELLAAEGHEVQLFSAGIQPGEFIPVYVRDQGMARLFKAGVKVVPYARFFGADADTVYFEHVVAGEPIVLEGVDTLVLAFGQRSNRELEDALEGLGLETHVIGDCLAPRTAEEAVLDGLKIGRIV